VNIKELLDICIDKNLIDMTISSRKLKDETKAQKVKIRPVIIKDTLEYQVSEFVGRKVLHTNYTQKDVKKRIEKYMEEEFKQAQITRTDSLATILSSKSGTCTCKYNTKPLETISFHTFVFKQYTLIHIKTSHQPIIIFSDIITS